MPTKYLRIGQAAERLGLSTSTLYHWCSSKTIPHRKIGQTLLFEIDEIDAWVEAHRVAPIAASAIEGRR